jgi:putative methyltransferase
MNFYFDAAKTLDRLDAKQGSIKGAIATLPEKNRKRTSALIIETLKCACLTTPKVIPPKLEHFR